MEFKPDTSLWEGPLDLIPEFDLVPARSAFLIVDMQYLDAHPDTGMGRRAQETGTAHRYTYYYTTIKEMLPRIRSLQEVCRHHGVEVIFTVVASNVKDCRDVSLQHKRLKILAPAGSKEAQILEEIAPLENELVLTKGCSGVFNGTAIDQILKNMGIDTLIICGVVTNGCVETAVRDASDKGYNVILVSDASAAVSPEDQTFAFRILNNTYCKVKTTQEVTDMLLGGVRARQKSGAMVVTP